MWRCQTDDDDDDDDANGATNNLLLELRTAELLSKELKSFALISTRCDNKYVHFLHPIKTQLQKMEEHRHTLSPPNPHPLWGP